MNTQRTRDREMERVARLLTFWLCCVLVRTSLGVDTSAEKPNIIILFADDVSECGVRSY